MSQLTHDQLLQLASACLADDPDPNTRAELQALLDAHDFGALAERFGGRLEFGTAGLRALLGAGDLRINRRVIAQTTAGLCAYLAQSVPNAQQRGLCVGFDGRHLSRELAEETCQIAAGAGFVVHVFEDLVPTPLLAFAVLERGAAAGVMITASHNPREYNGYKVYWENGAQIIPPHDAGIALAIERVGPALQLPRCDEAAATARGLRPGTHDLRARYLARVHEVVGAETQRVELCIAYTALHGVGEALARDALAQAGFHEVHSVPEQAAPDADFPTVRFPNPEESGAMDRVLALGQKHAVDLVIANDPDADRLALAAPTKTGTKAGLLQALTGNEVGLLLADHLLARAPRDGKNLVLSSIVSTPLIARVAAAHGAHWEPTLTGFKWIANRALELEHTRGLRFVFGFEEALGHAIGGLVRDKDGISAAALAARVTSAHKRAGRTLIDALEQLYRRYGLCVSRPSSITLPGAAGLTTMHEVMQRLRAQPPVRIGGTAITSITDLELGIVREGTTSRPATLPKSNALLLSLEGDHRIAIRPSGTEPKIKVYLDVCARMSDSESLDAARSKLASVADALLDAFLAQAGLPQR